MNNIIAQIKQEVLDLFPENSEKLSGTYCRKNWIFPNHLEPMIEITKKLCLKYNGDQQICELASLLHDTGLVYKRDSENPKGHENNSLEFAEIILKKYKIDEEMKNSIINCIKATEIDFKPNEINEKIVRTADILSQYNSMHFFAKAHFYPDWNMYLNFFEKKVNKGFNKICFEDERKEIEPIHNYFKKILEEYKKYN